MFVCFSSMKNSALLSDWTFKVTSVKYLQKKRNCFKIILMPLWLGERRLSQSLLQAFEQTAYSLLIHMFFTFDLTRVSAFVSGKAKHVSEPSIAILNGCLQSSTNKPAPSNVSQTQSPHSSTFPCFASVREWGRHIINPWRVNMGSQVSVTAESPATHMGHSHHQRVTSPYTLLGKHICVLDLCLCWTQRRKIGIDLVIGVWALGAVYQMLRAFPLAAPKWGNARMDSGFVCYYFWSRTESCHQNEILLHFGEYVFPPQHRPFTHTFRKTHRGQDGLWADPPSSAANLATRYTSQKPPWNHSRTILPF